MLGADTGPSRPRVSWSPLLQRATNEASAAARTCLGLAVGKRPACEPLLGWTFHFQVGWVLAKLEPLAQTDFAHPVSFLAGACPVLRCPLHHLHSLLNLSHLSSAQRLASLILSRFPMLASPLPPFP